MSLNASIFAIFGLHVTSQPTIHYDDVGDILYIRWCEPYGEQESVMTEEGVVYRRNPVTGALESVEILSLSRWSDAEIGRLEVDEEVKGMLLRLVAYAREA